MVGAIKKVVSSIFLTSFGSKKGDVGVGTLILFISMLLVAAIAAGVLIQTTTSLQQKSLLTGDEAKADVTSGFNIVDISASEGSDSSVNFFEAIIKLNPASNPAALSSLLLTFSTSNVTSTLNYKGIGSPAENSNQGYNTWTTQEFGELGNYYDIVEVLIDDVTPVDLDIDLDLDGQTDSVVVCRSGRPYCDTMYANQYVQFNLSTGGLYQILIVNQSGSPINLNSGGGGTYGNFLSPIGSYAFMSLDSSGVAPGGWRISANHMEIFLPRATLNEDLDDDNSDEALVINDTHVIVYYSGLGNITTQYTALQGTAYPFGFDLSSGSQAVNTTINLVHPTTSLSMGSLYIQGTTSRASYVDENVTFLLTPERINEGYYTISYVKQSSQFQEGFVHNGDLLKLNFEAPRSIYESEEIKFYLIPKTGSSTLSSFFMPDVIVSSQIHLYP